MMILRDILSIAVCDSLATGASIYIERNIALNQVLIANTYFAHYFIIALIACVVIIVLYFAIFTQVTVFADSSYLLIHMCISPVLNCFGNSVNVFLRTESRIFAMSMKFMFSELTYLLLSGYLYFKDQSGMESTLNIPALVSVSSNLVQAVFGIFMTFRIPFFDVEYSGILVFHFKRLSPIRGKFLINIFS